MKVQLVQWKDYVHQMAAEEQQATHARGSSSSSTSSHGHVSSVSVDQHEDTPEFSINQNNDYSEKSSLKYGETNKSTAASGVGFRNFVPETCIEIVIVEQNIVCSTQSLITY